jgi:syndecan 1
MHSQPAQHPALSPAQCEGAGSSFVTGFSSAERVSAFYQDTYYPLGQTECCTPALLLSSGDLWELDRWAGCGPPEPPGCCGM